MSNLGGKQRGPKSLQFSLESSCLARSSNKIVVRSIRNASVACKSPVPSSNKSSSLSPAPYRSYLSPKPDGTFTPTLQSKIENRIKDIREKASKSPKGLISLNKKFQDWAQVKSRLLEDLHLRAETRAQTKAIERKLETFESDNEDFDYTYITKLGRIRKFKSSLLGVSRHPNTYEMTPNTQSILKVPFIQNLNPPCPNFEVDLREAFKIKQSLAKKGIRSSFIDIANPITFPKIPLALPLGGENLLRLSKKRLRPSHQYPD